MIRLGCFGGLRTMNRMNRKGVAGKIITSFPVMILIFFIITIYIISAAVLYKVKGAPSSLAIEGVELDNVLLKEIDLKIEEKNVKIIFFDAIVKYWREEIDIFVLRDGVGEMVKEQGQNNFCFAFAQGESKGPAGEKGGAARDDFFIKFLDGKLNFGNFGYIPLELTRYENNGKLKEISFSLLDGGKTIYLQYYYGRCLEEGV